MRIKDTQLEC